MKKYLLVSISVGVALLPMVTFASIDTNLKYGSRGSAVTELQEFLIDKGFLNATASGNFFSLTNTAVLKYQASVGLPTTGFVGPMTRTKINADLVATTNTANRAEVAETGTTSAPSTTDKNTLLLNQIKTLQAQIATQTQTQQSIDTSVKQIVQNTTPAPTKPVPAPVSTPTPPSCAKNGIIRNCITFTPISVTGNATTTFTITTPVYRFGNGYGNTGLEACIDGLKETCIGMPSPDGSILTESTDATTLTYTTFVPYYNPTSGSSCFSLGTAGLFDDTSTSPNKYVNFSAGNIGCASINQPAGTNAPTVAITNDPATPSGSATLSSCGGFTCPLSVLTFDATAQNGDTHLHALSVNFSTTGTGTLSAAYLYNGSTQITSALITNGTATFTNIVDGTAGGMVYRGQNTTYTIKVDATAPLNVSATVNGSSITTYDSQDNIVVTNGSATGNTISVVGQ